jgi:flagellar protein FliO/FliZ
MSRGILPERNLRISVLAGSIWVGVWADLDNVYASTGPVSQPPGFGSPLPYLLNLFFALAVVVVLAILLIRFLARRANVRQKGAISILAARQLAPNKSIQVVEVGDKRYLLGVADEVTLIADVSDTFRDEYSPAAENQSDVVTPFRQMLLDKLTNLRESHRPQDSEEGEK